jgi:hypothetical protein
MTYLQIDTQRQFLQAFQDFWASSPASRILSALRESPRPYCACVRSWTKGGCLVGAEAMRRWIANSSDMLACGARVALAAVATDETEAAHVLVALRSAGKERFMDAAGVWTWQALERRLAQEYEYDAHALVPWEEVAVDRVRIPFDAQVVQQLEAALEQVLGPFSPVYVFLTSGALVARMKEQHAYDEARTASPV